MARRAYNNEILIAIVKMFIGPARASKTFCGKDEKLKLMKMSLTFHSIEQTRPQLNFKQNLLDERIANHGQL